MEKARLIEMADLIDDFIEELKEDEKDWQEAIQYLDSAKYHIELWAY